jgi:TonB family protein
MRGLAALAAFGVGVGVAAAQEIRFDTGLGTIDGAAVQRALDAAAGDLQACYGSGAGGLRYVGGHVRVLARVDAKGRVKRTEVADSDLGSWPVERCLLEVARKLALPAPKGGEAVVEIPLDFQPAAPADELPGAAARAAAAKLRAIYRCPGGPKSVPVTLYVAAGGAVTSAGFAGIASPTWGDCAAARVRALRLDDPLGRVLKGTVTP